MNEVLFSSKDQTWCTPQGFFDALDGEFRFILDAAATEETAKCERYFTPEDDGLSRLWMCRGGAVFCNPPYGREIGKWVKKAYKESLNGTTIVLLIPARTDTAYFHRYIYGKAEIRFVRGRLKFADKKGNIQKNSAPFPSMIVIYNGNQKDVTSGTTRVYDAADYNPKKQSAKLKT